jgi:hypothetical protein
MFKDLWRKHNKVIILLIILTLVNVVMLLCWPESVAPRLGDALTGRPVRPADAPQLQRMPNGQYKALREIGEKTPGAAMMIIAEPHAGETYAARLVWENQGLAAVDALNAALKAEDLTLAKFMALPFPEQQKLIEEYRP